MVVLATKIMVVVVVVVVAAEVVVAAGRSNRNGGRTVAIPGGGGGGGFVCLYRSQRSLDNVTGQYCQRLRRRRLYLDSAHVFMRTRASRCPLGHLVTRS